LKIAHLILSNVTLLPAGIAQQNSSGLPQQLWQLGYSLKYEKAVECLSEDRVITMRTART
jgi:hypothetical protein